MFSLVDILNHRGKIWYNGWTGGIIIRTGGIVIRTQGIVIGTGGIVIGAGGIVIGAGYIVIRGGIGIGKSRVNVWWATSFQRNGYKL